MNAEQTQAYENDYLPYIVKWGKITSWLSIPLIFIPTSALVFFYGASLSWNSVLSGTIAICSAMLAWYIVDPITLFPILHIPGMYLTYIAGNSKEIRAPAATSALSAADVEAGTPKGTIISCLAITTSIFISLAVMTLVAVAGDLILRSLPTPVVRSLNYLLPALFGGMCVSRVMLDYKSSLILIPIAVALRVMNTKGMFTVLPLGGSYAQVLFCVIAGFLVAKKLYVKT
ncbi:MAG: hypothetical protein LBD04_00410 [Synergistaceae bacterium]|jgi:energy-converting hydrogenase Eha subunit E|nr:hypothetical protein [Synergistaceae bacterium]